LHWNYCCSAQPRWYPLVNIQKTNWKITMLLMGKSTIFITYIPEWNIYINIFSITYISKYITIVFMGFTNQQTKLGVAPHCRWFTIGWQSVVFLASSPWKRVPHLQEKWWKTQSVTFVNEISA
jgi:hypothetical protein